MDIAVGAFGAVLTAIFFPFAALFIMLEDGFPIFVKLPRVSEGKIIKVWKFRTMIKNADKCKADLFALNERKDGPLFKIKNDPRITKTGKLLRKFRIDEFPQAFNVLSGKLSIVGPRPHEESEINKYPNGFKFIANARAGLTGLSQVSGASLLPFQTELELDAYYLNHISFFSDVKIIIKTAFIFFFDSTGQ